MSERDIFLSGTQDSDLRMLMSRMFDLCQQARRGRQVHGVFCDPGQQLLVNQGFARIKAGPPVWVGGYPGAERQMPVFGATEEEAELEITAVRFAFRMSDTAPGHRDVLGALMAQQIRRDMIGDILCHPAWVDVITAEPVASLWVGSVNKIGPVSVRTDYVSLCELRPPEGDGRSVRDTVASMRMDAVIAAACHLARSDAQELIRRDGVRRNWIHEDRADKEVVAGDVLSVRGFGRIRIDTVGGFTKKGRTVLEMTIFSAKK